MAALDTLLAGYRRFRNDGLGAEAERWKGLAGGQSPGTLVIACSDSRVEPATIFDTDPGEIFVVRNVAALVPPFEDEGAHQAASAAIEYAVTQLAVSEIVVLGHEFCGGCKAALANAFADAPRGQGGFVHGWVSMLDGARDRVAAANEGADAERAMEREAVRESVANLRTFPFVAEAERDGRLRLTGAWFSIADGGLRVLDERTGEFGDA